MEIISTLKTKVEVRDVENALTSFFKGKIEQLTPLKEGESSQAFVFTHENKEYIARINRERDGFDMDTYAYEHFSSPDIPIPKPIHTGSFGNTQYISISEKSPGKILEKFSKDEISSLMPSIISTLDAIHATPIPSEETFGDWKGNKTTFPNWKSFLADRVNTLRRYNSRPGKAPFYEPFFVEDMLSRYESLIAYCPNTRKLLHGDYGFSNTLSDGEKITGVIDWEQSMYGDPLFDVAWLDLWDERTPYADIFLKHYTETGVDITHYKERILCYQLYSGIGALKHFSASNQEQGYKYAKERLLRLTGE